MRLIDANGTQAGKYEVDARGSQGVQVGDHNIQHNTYIAPASDARRGGSGSAPVDAASASDPTHPLGVAIYARTLRNEGSGIIRADGPGSFVNLVADNIVNAGSVIANQSGLGTRLADHLRVIAGHISDDVTEWDKGATRSQGDGAFASQYVRYGRGRQAGELYDSAVRARLVTSIARAEFERAATPTAARRVANELVRWADELDRAAMIGRWAVHQPSNQALRRVPAAAGSGEDTHTSTRCLCQGEAVMVPEPPTHVEFETWAHLVQEVLGIPVMGLLVSTWPAGCDTRVRCVICGC